MSAARTPAGANGEVKNFNVLVGVFIAFFPLSLFFSETYTISACVCDKINEKLFLNTIIMKIPYVPFLTAHVQSLITQKVFVKKL